jgi:hypothetical protein
MVMAVLIGGPGFGVARASATSGEPPAVREVPPSLMATGRVVDAHAVPATLLTTALRSRQAGSVDLRDRRPLPATGGASANAAGSSSATAQPFVGTRVPAQAVDRIAVPGRWEVVDDRQTGSGR